MRHIVNRWATAVDGRAPIPLKTMFDKHGKCKTWHNPLTSAPITSFYLLKHNKTWHSLESRWNATSPTGITCATTVLGLRWHGMKVLQMFFPRKKCAFMLSWKTEISSNSSGRVVLPHPALALAKNWTLIDCDSGGREGGSTSFEFVWLCASASNTFVTAVGSSPRHEVGGCFFFTVEC